MNSGQMVDRFDVDVIDCYPEMVVHPGGHQQRLPELGPVDKRTG
jgi:hypothetical protein